MRQSVTAGEGVSRPVVRPHVGAKLSKISFKFSLKGILTNQNFEENS